uniref:Uncharacterized protein n=1 Tax=Clytia hemisphaerica TaxID=252671 RepID=A0A7M5WTI1_9CNID
MQFCLAPIFVCLTTILSSSFSTTIDKRDIVDLSQNTGCTIRAYILCHRVLNVEAFFQCTERKLTDCRMMDKHCDIKTVIHKTQKMCYGIGFRSICRDVHYSYEKCLYPTRHA